MSEHKVTEEYKQSNNDRLLTLTCSCELSVHADPRKKPARVLHKEIAKLHEAPKKEKKSKKQKPVKSDTALNEYGDDDFAQPSEEN